MSYLEVHQEWSYVNYKPKTENNVVDEVENKKKLDKTRHIVQMTRIKQKIDITLYFVYLHFTFSQITN